MVWAGFSVAGGGLDLQFMQRDPMSPRSGYLARSHTKVLGEEPLGMYEPNLKFMKDTVTDVAAQFGITFPPSSQHLASKIYKQPSAAPTQIDHSFPDFKIILQ